jgi:hypothetical protein
MLLLLCLVVRCQRNGSSWKRNDVFQRLVPNEKSEEQGLPEERR